MEETKETRQLSVMCEPGWIPGQKRNLNGTTGKAGRGSGDSVVSKFISCGYINVNTWEKLGEAYIRIFCPILQCILSLKLFKNLKNNLVIKYVYIENTFKKGITMCIRILTAKI